MLRGSSRILKALIHVGMTREGIIGRSWTGFRTIFSRASLTEDDVVLLRAVCAAVIRPRTPVAGVRKGSGGIGGAGYRTVARRKSTDNFFS